MAYEMENRELKERLNLVESMIAEGRRSTESWGWVFLLWGVAYYVAIAWASLGGGPSLWGRQYVAFGRVFIGLAWPVTMFSAAALTLAIGLRKSKRQPVTTVTRAVVSAWNATGISMLLLFPALGFAGRLDEHMFVAVLAAMLGVANGASGMILRWKMQISCAVVWWMTSVAACFGSKAQLMVLFLAAVFLCQIVFGGYAMICESRRRRVQGEAHA